MELGEVRVAGLFFAPELDLGSECYSRDCESPILVFFENAFGAVGIATQSFRAERNAKNERIQRLRADEALRGFQSENLAARTRFDAHPMGS